MCCRICPSWVWMGRDTHWYIRLGVTPAESKKMQTQDGVRAAQPKENADPGWSQGLATPAISLGVFSYSGRVH